MKICKKCEKEKPEEDFVASQKTGKKSQYCVACRTAYNLQWKRDNKAKVNHVARQSYERRIARMAKWRADHRAELREATRKSRAAIRRKVMEAYGGNPPKCACPGCNESRYEFLSIDHVNGGGTLHRRSIGSTIFRWLHKNNYPPGFRVLCYNCNLSRGFLGYCPHEHENNGVLPVPAQLFVAATAETGIAMVAGQLLPAYVTEKVAHQSSNHRPKIAAGM